MEPVALSVADTAKSLSLGRTSVYELIKQRRLDTVKIGRRTLVKMDSIRRLIDSPE